MGQVDILLAEPVHHCLLSEIRVIASQRNRSSRKLASALRQISSCLRNGLLPRSQGLLITLAIVTFSELIQSMIGYIC